MGIINQGILGGFSGKVGPIVGCHWKSKYYIRAHAAKVSNPRTKKQQEQRGKFATAFSFLKLIKPFIRIGFKEFAEKKSAFNAAMSYMLKRAVVGDGNEITIDFNRVLISTGSLMPVFESKATVSDNKMIFNWKDNSGMGNAEGTDIAMVLVYNKDKEEAVYDTEVGFRRNESSQLALPVNWQDDELVAYLSFRSIDGSNVANSVRVSISIVEVSERDYSSLNRLYSIGIRKNASDSLQTNTKCSPLFQRDTRNSQTEAILFEDVTTIIRKGSIQNNSPDTEQGS